jgi:hypothetical protein
MPEQRPTSAPQKGMITDINPLNLKENQYPYAMNAAVEGNSQDSNSFSLQNEGSNVLTVNFPAGFQVIGKRPIHEQNRTIYFLVNPTTQMSEIGEVIDCQYTDQSDDIDATYGCADCPYPTQTEQTPLEKSAASPFCTYRTIIQAGCLNFSMDHPVRAQYKIKDCDLQLYFTDGLNQRRFMYFDYENDDQRAGLILQQDFFAISGYVNDDCHQPIYTEELDCNKIAYHPNFEFPCVARIQQESGGSCKAGTYQFLIAYADKRSVPFTSYFPSTNPFPIFTKEVTFETNYETDKAIRIDISHLDQTDLFKYYNVVVAETIDNFTEFKLVGTYPVTKTTVIYTGNDPNYRKLDASEVLQKNVFYKTAGNVTKASDYLFYSNLAEWDKPNLQRVANKVKLYWETVAIPEAVYADPRYSEKYRGYPRDEVISAGMVFVTENGEELGTYHIPGPSQELFAQYGIDVNAPVNNNDVINREDCDKTCCGGSTLKLVGTVTQTCSDNNCAIQGETSLHFTFPAPTPFDISLEIGEVFAGNTGSFASGYNIFTPPPGVHLNPYYNGAGRPFVVTIPAGSTTYTASHIPIKNPVSPADDDTGIWVCNSCLEGITDLFIKTEGPINTELTLTSTQFRVTTIPTVFTPEESQEGCVVCSECSDPPTNVVVTVGCDCSNGGHTRMQFTFTEPTTSAITLKVGTVTKNLQIPTLHAAGYQLFNMADYGAVPWPLYPDPSQPFSVTIPAGVTTFTTGDIEMDNTPSIFSTWQCDLCGSLHLFEPKDVFIKSSDPNLNFVSGNSVILHTVASDATPTTKTCFPYWTVYNTGFVIDTPHEVLNHCDEDKIWEWGEFSYWQSSKRYPNDPLIWGDLCGKPIRHHRMPDSGVTHIHNGLNATKTYTDSNIVFPLGIRVDHQSVIDALNDMVNEGVISAADRARIKSYYIVRGNRVGHKSIVAKGLLYDMWSYPKDNNTYYYPNFPYNDLRANRFISNNENTYEGSNTSGPTVSNFAPTGRYTFHSPDIHFSNPTVGTELKLEAVEYGKSEGFFNHCEDEAKYKFLSTAAMTLAFAAGVATAFSAVSEKECTTYNIKSQSTDVSPVGGVTTWSNLPYFKHEKSTGLPIIPVIDPGSLGIGVESYQKTTCSGTPYQLLSPLSGSVVGFFLQQAIYKGVLGMKEMQIMIDLIKVMIPLKNFAIQYNSVGKYNAYKVVANNTGNKIREIKRSAYLDPKVQIVNEAIDVTAGQYSNVLINNWNRERSLYLKVDGSKILPSPVVPDTSRFTMNQIGFDQDDLGKKAIADVSSYYASIKNYVPDQYGFVTDVEYVSTGGCNFFLDRGYAVNKTSVFGGDTYISRFALKRKHPFFIQSRFGQDNESDVRYSDLGNAGFPNYYFNTEESLFERLSGNTFGGSIISFVVDLLGVANSRLDARKEKFFYQSGFIHLYNYGIPYFLCESDVNVDYRTAQNSKERDFYPHQQDLSYWLQQKNVPIAEDNYYFYNKTYSKQNKETVLNAQVTEVPELCKLTYPSSAIQSEQDEYASKTDNWLVFKANNKIDFSAANGAIMGLDGIENDKVLVRFENNSKIFAAYDTIKTSANEIQVGNGGVFNSRAKDFAVTSLGYAGSQHADLLQTEFGHIWVDAKRGNVFNLAAGASGLDELAKDGMKGWFKENLPFQITKDFPNFPLSDVDNNFKGIGLHMAFDKRFNRFFITKLDYKKVGPVSYNPTNKTFYDADDNGVLLTDKRYFCDKSWTISYNFQTQSWVSYHSFLPNFYTETVDSIQSGINGPQSSVWTHNLNNKSYQVYYGKLREFIVEVVSTPMMLNGVLNSVQYMQDAIRYHGNQDFAYNRKITFNKAIISNNEQTSGLLEMTVRDENNHFQSIKYPFVENNATQILVTRDRELWNFNQFWDVASFQPSNMPLFINKCNNCEKDLNLKALNYYKPDSMKQKIRGTNTKVRLINDKYSNYKFVFHFLTQQKESY